MENPTHEKNLRNLMTYFGFKASDLRGEAGSVQNSNKLGIDAVREDASYQLPSDFTPPGI